MLKYGTNVSTATNVSSVLGSFLLGNLSIFTTRIPQSLIAESAGGGASAVEYTT
jgi:hypothetical protein